MAINYTVQADVVDITADTPGAEDAFLVDTNVWYWLTYSRASQSARPPADYQTSNYPIYTKAALGAGARIFQSGLSLAELTHLIEKAEREIYEVANGQIGTKEYRHNLPAERARMFAEVQAACGLVTILAEPLTVTIDAPTANAALNRLQTEKVDGYDLFILESMRSHGVVQVITDDGDFATVPCIQVFTANRNVIRAARAQRRLITR
ncbi:PIN domain-containing protein [Candidatus Thiosymbion oneisti]|uniref:PIN domain-containing protein n=1 Tax=Candidatus Thiosymbion oneisti TaxID=589554 RepID=UPI000B7F7458|nr:PIN domain-containing protein [Candidatus Thiosymbion oneisti]